ncbi:MAG: ribosome biogenesis GTP-binding protein YihA/YsxC [bacterium]|nr:ribosome biogenesis GTP-binding protein YihA/YsxC [bacterium]
MEIYSAEFIKGMRGTDPITDKVGLHVAFIGRSNVGKSSVINSLTKRKKLVKSSSTPGKTTEINYFLINQKYYFVDLPGYGFAARSAQESDKIRKLILWYLFDLEIENRLAVLIVDSNVGLTDFDLEMLRFLRKYDRKVIVVANKVDRLDNSDKIKKIDLIVNQINQYPLVQYSAKNNTGRLELFNKIINS